jgi:hypothetical protein
MRRCMGQRPVAADPGKRPASAVWRYAAPIAREAVMVPATAVTRSYATALAGAAPSLAGGRGTEPRRASWWRWRWRIEAIIAALTPRASFSVVIPEHFALVPQTIERAGY